MCGTRTAAEVGASSETRVLVEFAEHFMQYITLMQADMLMFRLPHPVMSCGAVLVMADVKVNLLVVRLEDSVHRQAHVWS